MQHALHDKVVLVTGGASGIGAATARHLVSLGARVAVADRRTEAMQPLSAELGVLAVTADVSSAEQTERMVAEVVDHFGTLDVLVANAGVESFGSITEISLENWNKTLQVNLDGVFLSARAAIPALQRGGGGAIVVTGSAASLFSAPHYSAYVTSKTALIGLTRSIALDFGASGIRANAICPGWVRTELAMRAIEEVAKAKGITVDELVRRVTRYYPIRRFAEPLEIARGIAFLASSDASFITGTALSVDGGGAVVDIGTLEFAAD
jgi:NAD(P)-dependent dehydrogenase (short-subunit alcohol dehydrogenase family)